MNNSSDGLDTLKSYTTCTSRTGRRKNSASNVFTLLTLSCCTPRETSWSLRSLRTISQTVSPLK